MVAIRRFRLQSLQRRALSAGALSSPQIALFRQLAEATAHFVRLSSWRHQGEVPPVVTYFALIKQNPQFEARAQHAVLMRMMRFSPSSQKIFALQIFFGSPNELTDCFDCGGVCLSRRPRREAPRVLRAAKPPSAAPPPTCIKTVGKNSKAPKEYIATQLKQDKEVSQMSIDDLDDPLTGSK